MRILLAQNMPHAPAYGGANRSNLLMMEQLAARGHECHVVAPLGDGPGALEACLARRGAAPPVADGEALRYRLGGVQGHAVRGSARLVRAVVREIAATEPDRVLVPSDDPGAMVLGAALVRAPERVVFLAHTLQRLPFGPASFQPSAAHTALVRRACGTVAVSRAAQEYLLRWAGLTAKLIYPAVYGPGPFPVHRGDRVSMVNPCGYKGIEMFLAMADAFDDTPFLAVVTWGAGPEDLRRLARRPNIEVTGAVDDIDEVLCRTRALLMPSLWDETFGYTAVEAMLRGVPVLASAVGGLGEAKLGVPYLLPVNPITRYDSRVDPAHPPAEVPRQDPGPWRAALSRLLRDDEHHAEIADRSRRAAAEFVAGIDPHALESYLAELPG